MPYSLVGARSRWRSEPESPELRPTVLEVFHTALEPEEELALERAASGSRSPTFTRRLRGERLPRRQPVAAMASWLDEGRVATIRLEGEGK
jgi:hypothetical protein